MNHNNLSSMLEDANRTAFDPITLNAMRLVILREYVSHCVENKKYIEDGVVRAICGVYKKGETSEAAVAES